MEELIAEELPDLAEPFNVHEDPQVFTNIVETKDEAKLLWPPVDIHCLQAWLTRNEIAMRDTIIAKISRDGYVQMENYLALIRKVNVIDMQAAKLLVLEAPLLKQFDPKGVLSGVFVWSMSIKGNAYWSDIASRLPH